jgi:TatA/E family protein of Tat protein translocase
MGRLGPQEITVLLLLVLLLFGPKSLRQLATELGDAFQQFRQSDPRLDFQTKDHLRDLTILGLLLMVLVLLLAWASAEV